MTNPPTRHTPRLLLRAPEPTDVDPLFAIQGNREAMKHTFCAPDREATAAHIASYAARFDEDGFAPWTVVLASAQRIVRLGRLEQRSERAGVGSGGRLLLRPRATGAVAWPRELVRESLALAFEDLGLEDVGAFAKPENVASVRVLEKCGFERVRFVPELERNEYRIRAGASRMH